MLRGKRVLVLGLGNSATDVAVESSRIADKTFLAMRRGAYVLPKYMNGKPIDETSNDLISRLPLSVQRFFAMRVLGVAAGDVTDYGLPKPDHKLFEAHPTVSSELLPRLGHGDIAVKPNIERYPGGRTVRFLDGSEEEIDLVVYCTGYKITFPFFDPSVFAAPDNRMPLYRRVASADHPGLYFIGFIQPLGPIMPIAEAQAEWVADLLAGRAALPPPAEMKREIAERRTQDGEALRASKRHTVEVDFYPYLRELRARAKAGCVAGLTTLVRPPGGHSRAGDSAVPPPCGPPAWSPAAASAAAGAAWSRRRNPRLRRAQAWPGSPTRRARVPPGPES